MPLIRLVLIVAVAISIGCSRCGPAGAQDLPPVVDDATLPTAAPATVDGCQVIARIDGQVVLACEVLWQVNRMIEANSKVQIPPDKLPAVRDQLMKQTLTRSIDTKLLYGEFRRNIPPENIPRIEENLLKPFEENEMPRLMKQLNVQSQRDVEKELSRLGSSLSDVQRSFNERVIASEWVRTKVKVSEDVSPDEMVKYYREHLTSYDYPAEVKWEELMVRKSKYKDPGQGYAALATMGNEALQRAGNRLGVPEPVFGEVAKTKSDGTTAKDGGLHDWTTQGAFTSQALNQALETLPVCQMSPILESDTGFHIVRVIDRKAAGRKPFTEVQNDIREKLKDERFSAAVDKYLEDLHKDARIWTVYTGPVSADVLMGKKPGETKMR